MFSFRFADLQFSSPPPSPAQNYVRHKRDRENDVVKPTNRPRIYN